MADKYWVGGAGDGNFLTAGNYSGGVAPVNDDRVIFATGSVSVTAGAATGLTNVSLMIDDGYSGNIWTAGSPGVIGAGVGTAVLEYNNRKSTSVNIQHAGLATAKIYATADVPGCLRLSGTCTNIYVVGGIGLLAGEAALTTTLIEASGSTTQVQIGANITLTNAIVLAGSHVVSAGALTNGYVKSGFLDIMGPVKNTTLLQVDGETAVLIVRGAGATHTAVKVYQGFCNGASYGEKFTVTNSEVHRGGKLLWSPAVILTNPVSDYGAGYVGPAAATVVIGAIPLGH